ncbi:hypothetical protein CPB85DRAFT_164732 [Mucidula mucida]|nr:hypothetical protein CPB85DRAFT_164732 [Mucidula mucida]
MRASDEHVALSCNAYTCHDQVMTITLLAYNQFLSCFEFTINPRRSENWTDGSYFRTSLYSSGFEELLELQLARLSRRLPSWHIPKACIRGKAHREISLNTLLRSFSTPSGPLKTALLTTAFIGNICLTFNLVVQQDNATAGSSASALRDPYQRQGSRRVWHARRQRGRRRRQLRNSW